MRPMFTLASVLLVLALFSEFPCNYEIVNGKPKRIALCILRAIGFLSRSDMLTRGGGAGPETLTPDAQCLRPFDMQFALRPYDVRTERANLFAESMQWCSLPLCGYSPSHISTFLGNPIICGLPFPGQQRHPPIQMGY